MISVVEVGHRDMDQVVQALAVADTFALALYPVQYHTYHQIHPDLCHQVILNTGIINTENTV